MRTLIIVALALLCAASACSQGPGAATDAAAANLDLGPDRTAEFDADLPVAYFAGGCFWCLEASFERIEGVAGAVSGYSGGHTRNPTYEESNTGKTGHAEAIAVSYDPAVISYRRLLDVFFVAHDPTTLNRQGPDSGPQYRSIAFHQSPEQEQLLKTVIDSVNAAGAYPNPIVTEVVPFEKFWDAEAYHQHYYDLHPENPYIQNVSRPKVEKVEKTFEALLKEPFRKA